MVSRTLTRCERCGKADIPVVRVYASSDIDTELCYECYNELVRIFRKWMKSMASR